MGGLEAEIEEVVDFLKELYTDDRGPQFSIDGID